MVAKKPGKPLKKGELGEKSGISIHIFLIITGFLVAFLPRVFFALQAMPMRTLQDEMATMAGATVTAGYNWSPVLEYTNYYGWGFTILLGPLFRLFASPVVLYRVLLIVMGLVQSLVAPVCYAILVKFFNSKKPVFNLLMSVMCSYMVVTRAMVVYNEHMLILLVWCAVYLLLSLDKARRTNEKGGKLQSVLLAVLLAYAVTVHLRSMVMWAALVVVVFLYAMQYKKCLIHIPAFFLTVVPLTAVALFMNSYLQNILWSADTGVEIGNTLDSSVSSLKNFQLFLEPGSWQAFLGTIVGQITTIVLITCGVFAFAVPIGLKLFTGSLSHKNKSNVNIGVRLMILFCGVCIVATILLQAVIWLQESYSVVQNGVVASRDVYGTKAFTYVRYFGPYCGPLLLGIFLYFGEIGAETDTNKRKVFKQSAIVLSCFMAFIILVLYPYLLVSTSYQFTEAFFPFVLLTRLTGMNGLRYLILLVVIVAGFLFYRYVFAKNKFVMGSAVLTVLLVFQYGYNAIYFDLYAQESSYPAINALIDVTADSAFMEALPDKVYYYDASSRTTHRYFFLPQFFLKDKTVIPGLPSEEEVAVVLSHAPYSTELMLMGYERIVLDENEYVYLNDPKMVQALSDAGYMVNNSYYFDYKTQITLHYVGNVIVYDPDAEPGEEDDLEVQDTERGSIEEDYYISEDGEFAVYLEKGGIQFGPYLTLPQGRFRVTVRGQNLSAADVRATRYSGNGEIEIEVIDATQDCVVYEFVLGRRTPNVEFITENVRGKILVQVFGIELEYLGQDS